jgi:hypothetical protein
LVIETPMKPTWLEGLSWTCGWLARRKLIE